MDEEILMPKEQKWCCSGSKGCKDLLLISSQCYKNVNAIKNKGKAWIGFDRMPHSLIIKSLELFGINNKAVSVTKKAMS